jgi:hypothetical protein
VSQLPGGKGEDLEPLLPRNNLAKSALCLFPDEEALKQKRLSV